jgi:glycosyltransferase involved in cell wall biosynthesis
MTKKVLFVTNIISPFWIEFANIVNSFEQIEFKIAFCDPSLGDRGKHWVQANTQGINLYYCRTEEDKLTQWLETIYADYKPTIALIGGGIRAEYAKMAVVLSRIHQCLIGYFAEQPNQSNFFSPGIKHIIYKALLYRSQPDFFFAVGDRAVDTYKKLLPSSCHIAMCPYSQDLTSAFKIERQNIKLPVRFLFSGRLIPRNSIQAMTLAFERLAKERDGVFSWCISAYGPEEKWIRQAIERTPQLSNTINFDRDFTEWNDRLRPFAQTDVLVVPAIHSGWGLVIPEALAAGMPVITTRYVEAARYFVEDMVNGIFVEPNTESIYQALNFCVDNLDTLNLLRLETRLSARRGDVKYTAKRFVALLNRWFG